MSDLTSGIRAVAEAVDGSASRLNELDAQAGDGDLGVTMSAGSRVVLELLPGVADQASADVLRACGAALARHAPSTCGTLVATGLLRAARAAENGTGADAVAVMLEAARTGIVERGKAEPGSKTMVDALAPAADAALDAAARGESLVSQLREAAHAADMGAQATSSMVPRHGRAGWLAERSAGHEDGGARLVAIMLGAAADSVPAAHTSAASETA